MFSKKINKILISEEEEDNDLIINNEDDEFNGENDKKLNPKNNIEIKVDYNPPKESEIPSSHKAENTNESKSNEIITNKNIFTPVPNNQNIITNTKDATGEEKTIFSKITEDLYLDNKIYLKPKKIYFDISKANEDNYNKLTIENYLFTCADKENSKNNKIINNFLERKTKEQNNKKIGSDPEKDDSENFMEIKGLYSDRKKEKTVKYNGRSPEQFIKEQKILEEKHKEYIDNLVKKHHEEEKIFIKDRPTISKQSEKLANMKKSGNKDIHIKLYEEYNIKKQKKEERYKNEYSLNANNKYKKLKHEDVMKNVKRLHQENEIRKKTLNESKLKYLSEIKNRSAVSLIEKKSNVIIYKRLINDYKTLIKSLFNKNISDNFDMAYSDYLVFIYKLGLVEKDYNIYDKKQENNIYITTGNNLVKNFENKYNNFDTERFNNNNIKNKILFSQNILKRNTYSRSKSTEKNKINEESKIDKVKNSWKIITKNKSTSEEEEKGNSRRILLFILSVYGIYKGDLNDNFIKKEFPFLSQEEDKSYNIDENLAKQIYKYFLFFRDNAISNISSKNKEKDKEQDKNINNIHIKNIKINKDSKSYVKTIDCKLDKNDINNSNNKVFSGSKSTKKMTVYQKFKHNIYKHKTVNDSSCINHTNIKEKNKEPEDNKESIIKHDKKDNSSFNIQNNSKNNISENIKEIHNITEKEKMLNSKEQINVNNLKKNLKPKKELIMKKKLNLNKGITSSSTKNINYKTNKNVKNIKRDISNKNYNSNKNIKKENTNYNITKDNDKVIQNKILPYKSIISPTAKSKIPTQDINPKQIMKKDKNLFHNKISYKTQKKKIVTKKNEENQQKQINESKKGKKNPKEVLKHDKEKNSSISNYIFKEDYRIKEDIESNSNFNNLEEGDKKEKNKISSQNFSESEFNIEKNEDLEKNKIDNASNNNNINNNNVNDENKNLEDKKENNNEIKKKNKYIFKIKIKEKIIKLIINKKDNIESKIEAFCKENNLDDEDKQEILQAINSNLNL